MVHIKICRNPSYMYDGWTFFNKKKKYDEWTDPKNNLKCQHNLVRLIKSLILM